MDIRTKETIKYIVNLIFAVYNIVLGIASHSRWFLAVGLYYMVLSTVSLTMKSKQVWMKSKPYGFDEIKSVCYPCGVRFHHEVISSAKQIYSVARRI